MSGWKLQRESRRRKRIALQLLTVAGAIRRADVEIRYRGTDRLLVTWSSDSDVPVSEAVEVSEVEPDDERRLSELFHHLEQPVTSVPR